MPLYDYRCDKCKRVEERIQRSDEMTVLCSDRNCGGTMTREFHGRYGINMGVGAYGYYDETLQTYINSNSHKRTVMKEQGVSERFGKGWR